MTIDPFSVLGVSPDATLEEIRTARRKLAAEFHPDHGGDPVRMGEINIAFDAVVAQITTRPSSPPPPSPPASAASQPSPGRRYPGVQHDAPSFTIDTLPVEAFATA